MIAWSDTCGEQTRNIYVALVWMMIVTSQDHDVDLIKHKLVISVHAHKDFGLNRKSKTRMLCLCAFTVG